MSADTTPAVEEEPVTAALDDIKGWIEELRTIREEQKKLREREDRCKRTIMADLEAANATTGTVDGEPVVAIQTRTSSSLDTARMKRELGEIALAPYLTSTTSKSLVFPGAKK